MKNTQESAKTIVVKINHLTEYSYSEPVFLEPHSLKFVPRQDFSQFLLQSKMEVFPTPMGCSECLDPDGNLVQIVWFNELTTKLSITIESIVKLVEKNPYDFLVFPSYGLTLPMVYPDHLAESLAPMLKMSVVDSKVKNYAKLLASKVQFQTVPFLDYMIKEMKADFGYQRREMGEPFSSVHTLQHKRGSCRDLVVLAMDMCRSLGLATRFVSGYFFDESLDRVPELHAWFEAYIPGGGWRGFDPTFGMACYGYHIAIARGATPSLAASVTGSYRGKAKSSLNIQMELKRIVHDS